MIDFIANNSSTFGFSIWPGCDSTCTNRVRLGTLFAGGLDFNGGQESNVEVGFAGLRGTTSYRDSTAENQSCTPYNQYPEVFYDTSGFSANLWGEITYFNIISL